MNNVRRKCVLLFTIAFFCVLMAGCCGKSSSNEVKSGLVAQLIEDGEVPADTSTECCESYTTSNAPFPSTKHHLYRVGASDRYVLVVFKEQKGKKYQLDCKIVTWDGKKTREVGTDTIPDWKSDASFKAYYEKTRKGYEKTEDS